jgi:hypothetical protein
MPVDPAVLADNQAQLDRLRRLIASGPDYSASLGGGWTVGVALAHLAFWDGRAAYSLSRWKPGAPPPEMEDDLLNTVLFDTWKALPGEAAASLALGAAQGVTEVVKGLDDAVASDVEAHGYRWIMHRANHRREHIDQIEAALGG